MSHAAAELVARCFAARTFAHYAHLSTTSYAQHKALQHFYEDILDATDAFIECWMGVYGKVEMKDFPQVRIPTGAPVQVITDLRTWIAENREECCEAAKDDEESEGEEAGCTELANLLDNILAVADKAIYKLKFLA